MEPHSGKLPSRAVPQGENVIIFDELRSQGRGGLETHPGLPYDARDLNHFARGKRLGAVPFQSGRRASARNAPPPYHRAAAPRTSPSWRYMVVESDRRDIEACDWLKALVQLPLPIAAICETGGRLPHALLRVDAPTKQACNDHPAQARLGDPRSRPWFFGVSPGSHAVSAWGARTSTACITPSRTGVPAAPSLPQSRTRLRANCLSKDRRRAPCNNPPLP